LPGSHEILEQVDEGDEVVTRLRAVGTHDGDLPGVPRTGNAVDVTATVVHRIEDGKIAGSGPTATSFLSCNSSWSSRFPKARSHRGLT